MYTITRQDAADMLGISTRTIDRYAKSGKLRSKKDGKIIYLHKQDVLNLAGEGMQAEVIIPEKNIIENEPEKENNFSYEKEPEVKVTESYNIIEEEKQEEAENSLAIQVGAQARAIEKIYLDMRNEIQIKDKTIQDLSIELGKVKEIAGNSISLVDHKKSQFLLEESKTTLSRELNYLKEENGKLSKKVGDEKKINKILMLVGFVLLVLVIYLFIQKVG